MAKLERVLVILVALHSLVAGLLLALAPVAAVRLAGWDGLTPAFFGRQAGVFHIVLAAAYLIEYLSYRGIRILVIAKLCALVFLMATTAFDSVPWSVPLLGLADGMMGIVVWIVHRAARVAGAKQEAARALG